MDKLLLSQSRILLPFQSYSLLSHCCLWVLHVCDWFGPGLGVSLEVAKPERSQQVKKREKERKKIRHGAFLDWLSN